jgi:hypothetical protein
LDQLGKLQSELDVVQGNMVVLSEMLTELTPGEEHPSDLELLKVKCTYLVKGWYFLCSGASNLDTENIFMPENV